jgi:hypothetical protein
MMAMTTRSSISVTAFRRLEEARLNEDRCDALHVMAKSTLRRREINRAVFVERSKNL